MNTKTFFIVAMVLVCISLGAFSCDSDEEENKPKISVNPKLLEFTDKEEIREVVITTNQDAWDAVSDQTWCTITKGTNKFTVSVAANTTIDERTAKITVSAGDAPNVTVEVKQSGMAQTLSVTPNSPITFTSKVEASEVKTITVTTNVPSWDVSSNQTWCTVTKGTNQFTVAATANTTIDERKATISISAGNAPNVIIEATQVGVDPTLTVSSKTLTISKSGGSGDAKTITVTTNQPSWDAVSNQTWCTIAKSTNQFTVTASALTANANRSATITVSAGKASNVTISVTQVSEPIVSFRARNPVIQNLYNMGFFQGSRINFDMIVTDAAGVSSITITEIGDQGNPNGVRREIRQTRVIPISGPGTYQLSQEIRNNGAHGDVYTKFEYSVTAYGAWFSSNYSGPYSSYNGGRNHYFCIQ